MKADDPVSTGDPLLTSVSVSGSRDENCFDIEGALHPLGPFREPHRLELCSFTVETVKKFIADSVMSLSFRNRGTIFEASRFRNKFDAASSFFASIATLSKEL